MADGVFLVTRGRIVLRSRVRAGRGFVPWIATPGETFGSEGLSQNARYATDARADEESETLFLSATRFRAFVREQPQHALTLLNQLMAERAVLLDKLRELTTLSVEQRLIATLVRMAANQTFTGDDGRMVLCTTRYRLLCELVGATRESVSLVLARLTGEGLVERKGTTLIVAPSAQLADRLDGAALDNEIAFPTVCRGAGTSSPVDRGRPRRRHARPGLGRACIFWRLRFTREHMEFSSHSRSTQSPARLRRRARSLSDDELARYARQIRLPAVGLEGQRRLRGASVLIVGAGGLGSPAAMYLAAAGVGRIGIADGDRVDPSNLHRQLLHRTGDVGSLKTTSARDTIGEINPHVRVDAIGRARLRGERARSRDGVRRRHRRHGQLSHALSPERRVRDDRSPVWSTEASIASRDRCPSSRPSAARAIAACSRRPPEPGSVQNCADAGVLGVLPGLIGTLQATEALKLILGLGDPLIGRLLLVDTLAMRFRVIGVERDPRCPACGTREIDALIDYEAFCAGGTIPEPEEHGGPTRAPGEISPAELSSSLNRGDSVVVIDVREPYEWQIGRIPTARLIPLATLHRCSSRARRRCRHRRLLPSWCAKRRCGRRRSSRRDLATFEISSAASTDGVATSTHAFAGTDGAHRHSRIRA